MTAPDRLCTVLVHPDHNPHSPDACRLIRVAVGHTEWPWRRLTGLSCDVPAQGGDLSNWPVQGLPELSVVMGHHS